MKRKERRGKQVISKKMAIEARKLREKEQFPVAFALGNALAGISVRAYQDGIKRASLRQKKQNYH